ncbi:hypothetical protein NQ318_001078 [Aromia moschata]|uniref:Eukaryotic translation initiation factor 3 30 kDa subunit n=1 Tax=Aromia moschata TaxID=1265417 RepID=A0AAV8ZE54_9CUCU|nr:hypothetical protein NQ318_001078 [Aromia moschata]
MRKCQDHVREIYKLLEFAVSRIDDEHFDPPVTTVAPVISNKWEGEDEEDEVKESWEDEDEEKKEEPKPEVTETEEGRDGKATKRAGRRNVARRETRRQQESDLNIALETTFGGEKVSSGIDDLSLPETKEEFEVFTDVLTKKLTPLSKSTEYTIFIENLTRNLCATNNLYLEKQKIEKGDKAKKNKGKGKARLKVEGDSQLSQLSAYVNDFDDYDDFM